MWMTPLLAKMSTFITVAFPSEDLIVTPPSLVTVICSPPAVFKVVFPFGISPDTIVVGTTCLRSTIFNKSLFSGFKRPSNVSAGSLAKASSFGAKTVYGSLPVRVSTNFAALIAVTRVVKFWVATAASTIFGNLTPEKL